jgi:putative PIN family toxin of toxin-antitoxin system
MRVVIDTNVFVAGIFWTGPPAAVLRAWREGRIKIILSPAILDEYQRVALELSRQFPSIDLSPIIELLTVGSRMVPDSALLEAVCSDPDDDKFVAAALAGDAKFVITGDRALLRVREYGGVRMMTPAAFAKTFLTDTGGP